MYIYIFPVGDVELHVVDLNSLKANWWPQIDLSGVPRSKQL